VPSEPGPATIGEHSDAAGVGFLLVTPGPVNSVKIVEDISGPAEAEGVDRCPREKKDESNAIAWSRDQAMATASMTGIKLRRTARTRVARLFLAQVFFRKIPVDDLFQNCGDIIGTPVLVIKIIGVFPHVNDQ